MRVCTLAAAACLLLANVGNAQTVAPLPAPAAPGEQRSIAAFGDDKADCVQWTDGCFICKRQLDNAVACSTSGIACLPSEPACTEKTR